MSMNVVRMSLTPLEDGEPRTGWLYFTDDGSGSPVATHKITLYVEWSLLAKALYDNPETIYKEIPFNGKPNVIEDKDGNPV